MFKNLVAKLSLNPIDFFDEIPTRSVRGMLKLKVSVAKSRIRSDFLTCRPFKGSNLLLGKHDDAGELPLQTCRRCF